MFDVGTHVCHKKFPEEYGLGIVQKPDGDDHVIVLWEDEFGMKWEESMDISEIE